MDIDRGCRGKQRHASRAVANRVVRLMERQERAAFHVYRCANCASLHVGHLVPASLRPSDDDVWADGRRARWRRHAIARIRRIRWS